MNKFEGFVEQNYPFDLSVEDGGRRFIDNTTEYPIGKSRVIYFASAPKLPLVRMLGSMPQLGYQDLVVLSGEKLN